MGFKEWSYDNLLPNFKKTEKKQRSIYEIDYKYYGFKEELMIGDVSRHHISELIVEKIKEERNKLESRISMEINFMKKELDLINLKSQM